MKLLITGGLGRIGRVTVEQAVAAGHDVTTLDRAAANKEWRHISGDIRDPSAVRGAVQGRDAVLHLGAIPGEWGSQPDLVHFTNVDGTWNILQAASEAGIDKVVFFSSVNALGIWGGMRRADYLPVDDEHPAYPQPAYGLSKRLGEEMCASFTRKYGFSTYCLRPCFVAVPENYEGWLVRSPDERRQWSVGDYYSYVDVRDVAAAALCCLSADHVKHGRYLLTAADTMSSRPSKDLLAEDFSEVSWKGGDDYFTENPRRSLVDTSAAGRDLGWKPRHSWRDDVNGKGGSHA